MVLAELPGRVAVILQKPGDRRVLDPETEVGAREPHLAEAGAEHALARDEGRAPRGAALLAVVVGEDHALVGDAVDVGRLVAHQAEGVGADVRLPDVVAPDHQDVGFVGAEGGDRQEEADDSGHKGEGSLAGHLGVVPCSRGAADYSPRARSRTTAPPKHRGRTEAG